MINGRRKGNQFENDVCRLLTRWYAKSTPIGLSGDWSTWPVTSLPFRRRSTSITPLSGQWDGAGDILHLPYIRFDLCVECKNYANWEVEGVLYASKWPVWDWLDQCCRQAATCGLIPMLVLSRRHRPVYTVLQECLCPLYLRDAPHVRMVHAGERFVLASLDALIDVMPLPKLKSKSRTTS